METGKRGILVYQTWKLRAAIVVGSIICVVGGWQLYELGRARAAAELIAFSMQKDQLEARVERMDEVNAELQRQLAVLERAKQVDAEAYAAMRAERVAMDNEIHVLREELNFYRGIMSPSKAKVGLQAQDFLVAPLSLAERRYAIRLMMVQIKNNQQVVSGNLQFTLKGVQDARPRLYSLADLAVEKHSRIKYRFRYFQSVEDVWELPEGFEPEQLIVKAVSAVAKQPSLEWTFQWPEYGEDAEEVNQDVGKESE